IAEAILGIPIREMDADIDRYNHSFYQDPNRRFLLGVLALHQREDRKFFSLETVEVDTMGLDLLKELYSFAQANVDPSVRLFIKPANHHQESLLTDGSAGLPKILAHELFATARFIPLNHGTAKGRLRAFTTDAEYARERDKLEWYDIIDMP